jgi:hypothetical protein
MAEENWTTVCADGFGVRAVSTADSHVVHRYVMDHASDFGAIFRRYFSPAHPYLRYRERLIRRRKDHVGEEPKANLLLDPGLARLFLKGVEPLSGRHYLLLSLAQDTPGSVIQKVAANFVLAEAGPGGSLESAERRWLEDLLLRIASWPDDKDLPIRGEWGLDLQPLPEQFRPAVAAALRGERTELPLLATDDALGPPELLPPLEAARLDARFDQEIRIRMDERAIFPDGLGIKYWGTSHKRTRVGDPSCLMPYLDCSQGGMTEMVDPRWHNAKDGTSWGDPATWEGYRIELTGLDYDREVRIRVTAPPSR